MQHVTDTEEEFDIDKHCLLAYEIHKVIEECNCNENERYECYQDV